MFEWTVSDLYMQSNHFLSGKAVVVYLCNHNSFKRDLIFNVVKYVINNMYNDTL